jgi:uncharacterized protein (TIGR00369 family)
MKAADEARIRASFASQALMATFGAELRDVSAGRAEIVAPILQLACQQHGYGHAGLVFALGDSAAGYAALTTMGPAGDVLTAEMKINLLRPAAGDRLIAVGEVAKAGRRLTVVTATVWAETGTERRKVAVLQGTMVAAERPQ